MTKITIDRSTVEQTLEVLEEVQKHMNTSDWFDTRTDNLRAALAEPVQEPDVPATNFGNMEPVGWLESPHGAFRANPLYKIQFPSQLLSWQVPVFAALAEPGQEPVQTVALWGLSGNGFSPVFLEQAEPPEPLTVEEALAKGWRRFYSSPPKRAHKIGGEA